IFVDGIIIQRGFWCQLILEGLVHNALIQIKAFHFLTNAVDGPVADVPSAVTLVKMFAEGATAKTLKRPSPCPVVPVGPLDRCTVGPLYFWTVGPFASCGPRRAPQSSQKCRRKSSQGNRHRLRTLVLTGILLHHQHDEFLPQTDQEEAGGLTLITAEDLPFRYKITSFGDHVRQTNTPLSFPGVSGSFSAKVLPSGPEIVRLMRRPVVL